MSALPEPRPVEPSETQPTAADAAPTEPAVPEPSEFISEDSPEVRAIWASQVRVVAPADTASGPTDAPDGRSPSVESGPLAARPGEARAHGATESPRRPNLADARLVTLPVPVIVKAPARSIPWLALFGVVALAVAVAAVVVGRTRMNQQLSTSTAPSVVQGTATIVSRPTGAEVLVNGVSRGTTPLRLTLPVGTYDVELRNGGSQRSLSVTVDPSTATREFVDLAPEGGPGTLDVSTDVPGARVTVDGAPRGVTPLVLTNVEPGTHRVGVSTGDTTIFRTVTVTAGATASVVASASPAGAAGGWLTIAAPITLQVVENGEVIGSSDAARIMLPAGHHDLRLVSAPYEFDSAVSTQIPAGHTVSLPVDIPNGTVSINATPWADVFLDGRAVGSTPIGNLSVSVGLHEVVWRHPQLGERRQTIRVGARTPVRVAMDLTRAP